MFSTGRTLISAFAAPHCGDVDNSDEGKDEDDEEEEEKKKCNSRTSW